MEKYSSGRYRAKHLHRKGGRNRRGPSSASQEGKAVLRLTVCGIIFVVLVAIKLLFPQTVSRLAQTAGDLIGRDADFKEAFAAMGRAVSGDAPVGDSLQDAYTAVFNPVEDDEAVLANAGAEVEEFLDPAAKLMRFTDYDFTKQAEDVQENSEIKQEEEESAQPQELQQTEQQQTQKEEVSQETQQDLPQEADSAQEQTPSEETATAAVSQVYTMPALPENASLEQRNLGFAHTSPIVAPLTSPFGWREHPVSGGTKFHYGVDLGAATGTDICAFADGEVYATGDSSSLGYYIMIQHQDGYMTLYAHCSKITVTSGKVTMGQKIAEVGETGIATGPHLHFELHDGDLYLNPIYYVELQ